MLEVKIISFPFKTKIESDMFLYKTLEENIYLLYEKEIVKFS